jgi:hypothetical protein
MDALLTLIGITFGLPVALLFLVGYVLRHRRSRDEAMFGTDERLTAGLHLVRDSARGYAPKVACWELRGCSLAKRDKCPAYNRTYLPCWLAVQLANGGHLERACVDCLIYQPERIVEGVAPLAEATANVS